MKIGLLGGSFDPIHDGHVLIASTVKTALNLDEVWFIPVLNNPFKDRQMASGEHRIKMIELATRKDKQMKVCDIELKGDPSVKSYTYHTMLQLTQMHPNDEFYYIIGADQVEKFDHWYEAKKLSEIVQMVGLGRKGYETNKDNIKAFNMLEVDYEPIKASSTAVREGNFKHVDKKVIEYFTSNGLYLESIVATYMSKKRFIHTTSMASLAVEIAQANDIDPLKAYVAGMLHDVAKEMDSKKARKIMEKHFPEHIHMPEVVWHQWLSSYVAKKTFKIKDQEILQAIINHTTASCDMSRLDMCIYCADKYDRSRGYDSSKEIELCKKDIREGFKQSLEDFYTFSKKKNRPIDPIFFDVYKTYVEDNNG